jgi:hypothetical protein
MACDHKWEYDLSNPSPIGWEPTALFRNCTICYANEEVLLENLSQTTLAALWKLVRIDRMSELTNSPK